MDCKRGRVRGWEKEGKNRMRDKTTAQDTEEGKRRKEQNKMEKDKEGERKERKGKMRIRIGDWVC